MAEIYSFGRGSEYCIPTTPLYQKEPAKVGWVFQPSAAEMRPRADPGQTGDITSLGWLVFIMLVCLFQLFYSENDPDWFHHVNPAQIIT